jgi:deoxycytidylate deaminase
MNERWFEVAKVIAQKIPTRVKIGGVLVYKGKLINVGSNRIGKTHTRCKRGIHCELDCLLGIKRRDLVGTELYLYRINSLGETLNCKPCVDCQELLREFGIKRVYYTKWSYNFEPGYCYGIMNIGE